MYMRFRLTQGGADGHGIPVRLPGCIVPDSSLFSALSCEASHCSWNPVFRQPGVITKLHISTARLRITSEWTTLVVQIAILLMSRWTAYQVLGEIYRLLMM